MANAHIATYLNDHLAGSAAALELLEHLQAEHAGADIALFAADLQVGIAAARQDLEMLMSHLDVAQSHARKASAWLAGKGAELKLRLDDPAGGSFRLLETLEALSLGIAGQIALWQALAAVAEDAPALRVLDYEGLVRRAEGLRRRVEVLRLGAAKKALSVPGAM